MRSALTTTALIASAALVVPLAACNKQPSVSATNATPAEVQQKVAAAGGASAMTIEPGRWEGTTAMHDLELPNIPNLPPQAKERMKAQMSATQSFASCVTADDVKRAFMTDKSDNKNCKFDHFTLSGGRIDAAMACDNGGREGKMAMTMTGTYSSDAYHMDMSTRATGGGPMSAMTMKVSIDARRVGACRGTKDEK